MKKPSIFSKDYEKIMRKRRKKKITLLIILSLILIFGFTKIKNINYLLVKERLQAWIDEGKNMEELLADKDKDTEKDRDVQVGIVDVEEKEEKKEEKIIEINLNNSKFNMLLKINEKEEMILGFENLPNDTYYEISEDGKSAILIDGTQNLFLMDYKGGVKDITFKKYVTKEGDIFEKENILSIYEGYIWTAEARYLSDKTVVYRTNVPYFGYNLNQYVTVVNVETGSHKTLWNTKGKEINFGEFTEKGLEVKIDGNIKYIDMNTNLIW